MAPQGLDQLVLFQAQITGTVWAQVDSQFRTRHPFIKNHVVADVVRGRETSHVSIMRNMVRLTGKERG